MKRQNIPWKFDLEDNKFENQLRITRMEIDTFPNGDTIEYSEELRFQRA